MSNPGRQSLLIPSTRASVSMSPDLDCSRKIFERVRLTKYLRVVCFEGISLSFESS